MPHSMTAGIRTAITVIALLFLAGCMTGNHGVKRMAGAGLGGIAGCVPGTAATVARTMAGLFPGV